MAEQDQLTPEDALMQQLATDMAFNPKSELLQRFNEFHLRAQLPSGKEVLLPSFPEIQRLQQEELAGKPITIPDEWTDAAIIIHNKVKPTQQVTSSQIDGNTWTRASILYDAGYYGGMRMFCQQEMAKTGTA